MQQIVVHIETKNAKHQEYVKSSGNTLKVGKDFSNDLIVSDQHIAPQQLVFERNDTAWTLRSLDSTNPVLRNRLPLESDVVEINAGDKITIGRTQLRVYDIAHPFDAAKPLPFSGFLNRDSIGFLLPLLALVVTILFTYGAGLLVSAEEINWSEEFYGVFGSISLILFWAACWSMIGARSRGAHFGQHIFFTAVFFLLLELLIYVFTYVELQWSSKLIAELGLLAAGFALFAWLLKYNLFFATQLSRPTFTASVFCAALFFLSLAGWLIRDEQFNNRPYYSDVLGPSQLLSNTDTSVNDYMGYVRELASTFKIEVDEEQ